MVYKLRHRTVKYSEKITGLLSKMVMLVYAFLTIIIQSKIKKNVLWNFFIKSLKSVLEEHKQIQR